MKTTSQVILSQRLVVVKAQYLKKSKTAARLPRKEVVTAHPNMTTTPQKLENINIIIFRVYSKSRVYFKRVLIFLLSLMVVVFIIR